jgi:AcrR family transcriptional regulator
MADGLRERKKRETRDALSAAAIRLTVERGWDNVTVEDIAEAADVSVRTFRNYYSSKAEAIAARHLDRVLRIVDALRARPATEPLWDAIGHAVRARFAADDSGQPRDDRWGEGLRLVLAQPALHGEVLRADATAQAELAKAVAERTGTDVDRDVYPKLVAAAVGAATTVAVEHALRADPPVPLDTVLRDVLDQLSAGLPTP